MNVEVTKDTVTIIDKEYIVNKGEYHVNKCHFTFSEEYTPTLVKKAIFVDGDIIKEMIIANDECDIPYEVLNSEAVELRVYAYEINGEDLILRYSPTYDTFYLRAGSYIEGASQGEEITPTQFEQYEQALQEGLAEVDEKLVLIDGAIDAANNLDIEATKSGKVATVTVTKKDATTEIVNINDGTSLMFNWDNTKLGIKTDDDVDYEYQDLKGEQGKNGADGEKGADAVINGVNTLNLVAGDNITLEQDGDTLTINSTGGSGGVTSVNGQTGDVVINIPDVSDFITKDVNNLTNYELKADTGHSIEMSINSSTYVLTLSLKNSAGTILNTQTIDLPLETMVVDGEYDSTNKKIILELQNGNTIDVPVGDLINGLQTEITSSNKLSADLVDDTNTTNKFTNSSEKAIWNAKSDFSGDYDDLTNKPNFVINVDSYTFNAPLIISDLKPGSYILKTSQIGSKTLFIKATSTTDTTFVNLTDMSFYYPLVVLNAPFVHGAYAFYCVVDDNRTIARFVYRNNQSTGFSTSNDSYPILRTYRTDTNTVASTNTFTGSNTFNTLPTSTVVPTSDSQFVNKKYVDDSIASAITTALGGNY